MTKPRTTTKRLSSSKTTPEPSKAKENRYDLSNAGPSVGDKAGKLAGRSINHVPAQQLVQMSTTSLACAVVTNVIAAVGSKSSAERSISNISSTAGQFNTYRFDESLAIRTYKKMMTIHLKDEMFCKLKFITSGEMMEFSRTQTLLCSYVCTKMRVADYQWGEYWDMVKHTAKKMIEQQRTNATSAIKKGFRGK